MLHYAGRPLVHFALVIVQPSDHTFNALRQNKRVIYADVTSKTEDILKHSLEWKKYLFDCDISLICAENNLWGDKSKRKTMFIL